MSYEVSKTSAFRVIQPLVLGPNTITHNLALSGPLFASNVEVRDNSDGSLISARVSGEGTNSLVVDVGQLVASARITVVK